MDQDKRPRGLLRAAGRELVEGIKRFGKEIAETLTDKVIPQGSAEVAQALYTGSAFTPYGAAQSPLEPYPVQGEKGPQQSFEQTLDGYASRASVQEQDKQREQDTGMER
jgi:hypothetical protein